MSERSRSSGATRRDVMAGVGALSLGLVRPARATPDGMAGAIKAFAGEAEIRDGKVILEIPPLVENGSSVPLTVKVGSPMTPQNHVKTIAIFNERNPQPNVANFHLGPRAGRAIVSTRIRLGESQTIVAIARMSDGSYWSGSAELVVTLPTCVES
jgi:sulfur-oxidizing protein SoxY